MKKATAPTLPPVKQVTGPIITQLAEYTKFRAFADLALAEMALAEAGNYPDTAHTIPCAPVWVRMPEIGDNVWCLARVTAYMTSAALPDVLVCFLSSGTVERVPLERLWFGHLPNLYNKDYLVALEKQLSDFKQNNSQLRAK